MGDLRREDCSVALAGLDRLGTRYPNSEQIRRRQGGVLLAAALWRIEGDDLAGTVLYLSRLNGSSELDEWMSFGIAQTLSKPRKPELAQPYYARSRFFHDTPRLVECIHQIVPELIKRNAVDASCLERFAAYLIREEDRSASEPLLGMRETPSRRNRDGTKRHWSKASAIHNRSRCQYLRTYRLGIMHARLQRICFRLTRARLKWVKTN